jgi:hypothetical protein
MPSPKVEMQRSEPERGCDVIIHGIAVERPPVDLVLLLFFSAGMLVIGRTNRKSKCLSGEFLNHMNHL